MRTVQFCLHCAVFILIRLFLRLHGYRIAIYTLAHAQKSCRENSKWLPATKKRNQSQMREKRTLAGLMKRWPFFYKSSCIAYKAEKTSEGLDWDSVRWKYDGILEKFIERFPNNEATSEFPHSEDTSMFTKNSLVAKIKRVKLTVRISYRIQIRPVLCKRSLTYQQYCSNPATTKFSE